MGLTQLMAEDSAEQMMRLPSDDDLRAVSDLANEQLRLEGLVVAQEQALKELKEQLVKVREFDLPSALEALGLTALTLSDKSKVSVKEEVYAGITEENRAAAFEWLETTGNDGIIKNKIECPFGKGQDADAKVLTKLLASNGFSFTSTRTVHPQTLRAFIRNRLEDASPVPVDIFSIHIRKVASIELPRKREK